MPAIHLFGGEKGGVGKSFVCRTAIAYHQMHEIDFAPFDTDRSNPDVMRTYEKAANCQAAILSEDSDYADAANIIFRTAINRRVLVNLSAQSYIPLKRWLDDNDLFGFAEEEGIKFYLWFVSDCGYESLNLLSESLKYFGDRVQHVMVANYGMTKNWEPFTANKSLQELIAVYGVKVMRFPKFVGNEEREKISSKFIPFESVLKRSDDFDKFSRRRVRIFLKNASSAFEAVGYFDAAK
ncbi:MAG: hypothetical protein AAFW84_24365 [Cyanobacteria bacterium J06635_15]